MRAAGTWGTGWRQRLRLMPMYLALRAAGRLSTSRRPAVSGMPVRPGISVVIPERGTPELLAPALASVERALARCAEPSEVIVVVNGADPAAYADLKARHPATEWLHFGHPLGFSAAVARGVARASMPWTLLLNSDCELDERAVERLARRVRSTSSPPARTSSSEAKTAASRKPGWSIGTPMRAGCGSSMRHWGRKP